MQKTTLLHLPSSLRVRCRKVREQRQGIGGRMKGTNPFPFRASPPLPSHLLRLRLLLAATQQFFLRIQETTLRW